MAEMADVVKEISDGKSLLAADTDKKETDLSSDEEDDDDNDFILVEDERITKSSVILIIIRENKAKLPPNTKFSYLSDEDDEYEQDWAIVHKQLLETDGFHVDYLPNKHKRNWYQKILGNSCCKYTIEAANLAVAEYNKLEGANLEITEIINVIQIGFDYYYLTLQCTDGKYYEVKVFLQMSPEIDLEMFRPAKHYPRPTTTTTTSEEKEEAAASD
ncbi:uncharacterized protein LOC115725501 isoform X4 [Cannabis sativa]|uniref:uncharacterized protein LOC115725501 isoform X4 n=1 Tax=Cannabis sativa TaxID=3483 RepID=UPI0029C9B566|nr:uncharacterized protein LOC115725501 isoform X4 [Cannabis sativa]